MLSNTLFRRDAGALRTYLVDAETAEIYPDRFPAASRFHDLQIMEENVNGDLLDLDTEVGERGGRLSMGQRQLVSLMHVLVQRPAIFILDEATASIDPFNEWQIEQALNMILSNTTCILNAHCLSTVRAAGRIIVLETCRIIEQGNHASLLAQGGHYAGLYNTYFRHQSLAYVEKAKEMAERGA